MQQPTPTPAGDTSQVLAFSKYTWGYFGLAFIAMICSSYSTGACQILTIVLLLCPLVGLGLLVYGNGAIRLYAPKGSRFASAFGGLLCSSIGLVIQVALNTFILPPYQLVIPSALAVLVIFVVLYFIAIKKVNDKVFGEVCLALVIAILYGTGGIAGLNAGFDFSKERICPAVVTGHYTTQGKGIHYHLTIGPWGNEPMPVNITVSAAKYAATPIGSQAIVHLKQGALGSPWFYITE